MFVNREDGTVYQTVEHRMKDEGFDLMKNIFGIYGIKLTILLKKQDC